MRTPMNRALDLPQQPGQHRIGPRLAAKESNLDDPPGKSRLQAERITVPVVDPSVMALEVAHTKPDQRRLTGV